MNTYLETIQIRTAHIGGREVLYYTAGWGEPLVVIHGGGSDARAWWNNIRVLAEKYTVYAPDLPGYGGSQKLDGNYYVPELTQFIDEFALSLGLKKFYIMGHSLGGAVALNYTLKFPQKIRKLVLVDSLCLGREVGLWLRFFSIPAIVSSLGAVVGGILNMIVWILKMVNPFNYILPFTQASVAVGVHISSFKEQTFILEQRLPELKIPTLVVWGAKDPVVPVTQAYRACKTIPDCQIEVFRKSGHNPNREELKKFSKLLFGFLG
jgi:pimeloyl-ACP methyl ester carboxylesterase